MQSCVDVPIGRGVIAGGIKDGGVQRDITRHRSIAVPVSYN